MHPAAQPEQATQRLFFALWPPAKLQAALHRVGTSMQNAFGGRVVKADNIHLTLAFLGSVPEARVDELLRIGSSIAVERFQINLSESGCWKRSAVAWVGPDAIPGSLEALVLELRQQLLKGGFRVDDKPFAAHVTLLRKAKCRIQPLRQQTPIEWRVDRFVLMRSETLPDGASYSEVAGWTLR